MTQATAGPGFLLQKGDGANPENFTTVAEVKDITGPQIKVTTKDATNQSSTGAWAEKVATIKDGGTVTFKCNAIPSTPTQNSTTGLLADLLNKTLRNFRIQNQDGAATRWNFAAFVTDLKQTAPVDGILEWDMTLTISGAVTTTNF
jgi:predicted secreted protein